MKVWLTLFILFGVAPALGQSVPPSGGTMTGPLVLSGNPTSTPPTRSPALQAATKQYRDQISISAADYGAKCDGATDDTAALNSALNADAGTYTVTLPQGTCLITSPIIVVTSNTNFPSLVGTGSNTSMIQGDYTAWPNGPQAMIEINSTGKVTAVYRVQNRRFGEFSITPKAATIGSHAPIGIEIKTTAAGVTAANVDQYMPLFNASLDHILFSGFSQAISMTEGFNVNMESLRGAFNENGISIAGESININIDACTFGNTAGTGIGIFTGPKTYGSEILAPQAVHVENGSAFVSYQTNAYIGAGLFVTLDHSVFDIATANSIVVLNSNNTFITSNYIESNNAKYTGVLVLSPPMHLDGLWIENNFITGGSPNISGIQFASGVSRRGVHIIGNRITGVANPIALAAVPAYSEIKGNYGQANQSPLITIDNAGPGVGTGLSIEGNTSSDPQAIIKTRGALAPSYFQDNNFSASGPSPSTSLRQVGYFTTNRSASDTYTSSSSGALPELANLPAGAHCYAQAADATAAGMTGVFIAPLATAGTIVLSHSPVAGAHFSIACAAE
jgi:hypothetical protein